jgi:hypothetical protein
MRQLCPRRALLTAVLASTVVLGCSGARETPPPSSPARHTATIQVPEPELAREPELAENASAGASDEGVPLAGQAAPEGIPEGASAERATRIARAPSELEVDGAQPSAVGGSMGSSGVGARAGTTANPVRRAKGPPGPVGGTTLGPGTRAQTPESHIRLIKGQVPMFLACYKSALTKDPAFQAKLRPRVVVAGNGRVRRVSFPSASAHAEFDACVARAMRAIRFPPGPDGKDLSIDHHLVFKSR